MESIGSYRVISDLGAGAFGVVYEAYQPFLDRRVAIKTLRDVLVSDPILEQNFMAEARTIARLRHPNIVTIFEFGTTPLNGQPTTYLVMEYLPGQTLLKKIRDRSLSLPNILTTLRELASALDFAHTNNIVHCDLKPANIIFTEGGQPVIVDFGLSRLVEISSAPADPAAYIESTISGTPAYAAPEQFAGQRPSKSSDIYALATIAFEMLTGRLPFPDNGTASSRIETPAPLLSAVTPQYGKKADSVLARALSPIASERYATAESFVRALSYALLPGRTESRPITVIDPQQTAALKEARRSVRGFAWGIVTAVALFSLFCIALFARAYVEGQPTMLTDGINTLNARDADGLRTVTSVWPDTSAHEAGITAGDRLAATIDQDRELPDMAYRVNGMPRSLYGRNWQPQLGDEIQQEIVRGGQTLVVIYRIERAFALPALLLAMLTPAAISFGGAVIVLRRYGDEPSAQFFTLMLLELAFTLVATGVIPALPGLWHVAFYLFFGLIMHFMWSYPSEALVLRRFPAIKWLFYAPVLLGLAQFLTGGTFLIGNVDANMIVYAVHGFAAFLILLTKWIMTDARTWPRLWLMITGHLIFGVSGGIAIYLNIVRSSPAGIGNNNAALLLVLYGVLSAGAVCFALTQIFGYVRMQQVLRPAVSAETSLQHREQTAGV